MPFTATSGWTAPGMAATFTGVRRPALSMVSAGCWPSCPAAAVPAATTAPPVVTATPETVPAVAPATIPADAQEAPLALVKARTLPPLVAVITAPAGPPATVATVSPAPPWPVTVAPNFQVVPSAEVNTTASVPPLARPGRTAANPFAVAASPAIVAVAPLLTGTVTADQDAPPFVLRQTTDERTAPWALSVLTTPETTMAVPSAAAAVSAPAVPPPAARCSWAAPSRRQVTPLTDVQTTGLAAAGSPGGTFSPAARNPVAVRRSTFTWSPPRIGAMPWAESSVQVWPSWLVHMALGPRAAHRP